jgi:hypothetical protein
VGAAIWEAAKRHDPEAIIYEPDEDTDSGGPTLGGGRWEPALWAAAYAAAAYAYPELFSIQERRILARSWEAVFGPLGETRRNTA